MREKLIKDYIRNKWEFVSPGVEKLSVCCSARKLGSDKNMNVEFMAYRAIKDFFSANTGSSPKNQYEFHIDSFVDNEQRLRSNSIIVINGGFFDSPIMPNDGLAGYGEKQPIGFIKPKNPVFNFSKDSQYYCHNVNVKYKDYYGLIYTTINNDDNYFKIKSYKDIPLPVEDFLSQQSTYVSGAPILIQHNNIIFDENTMKQPIFQWNHSSRKNAPGFLHHADQPNPRSIFGLNYRYNYFVTVKGRSGHTIGLNLAECAILMSALGCTDAVNLDGGGSSRITYANRKKEKASYGGDREIPDVLFLTRKDEYYEYYNDFENLKTNIARCFDNYIKNRISVLFSKHHHNDRAKEVKKVILKSYTVLQVHAILLNQISLFNKDIKFVDNYNELDALKDKYASNLKNNTHLTPNNSGYVRALYAAYGEGKKLYPNSFTLDLNYKV